jgi:SPP1 family predicted phage head-tail adaptor
MKAGELDRRIELQHRTLGAPSPSGEQIAGFTTYDTVWAKKTDQTAREVFIAGAKNADQVTRFTVRYRDDVLVTDRILYKGGEFDIFQISEIGRAEGLEIFTTGVPA